MTQNFKNAFSFMALTILAATVSSAAISYYITGKRAPKEPEPKLLTVKAASLLAPDREYLGQANRPYTLIEFMDYQCPPCKRTQPILEGLLRKNETKLRYTIRNYPLEMHRFALPAAIAAEAAHEQGQFWPVHDALIRDENLSEKEISRTVEKRHFDAKSYAQALHSTAKARVLSDLAEAKTLDIPGTPSFLLCCPNGDVLLLHSLGQLNSYLR